MVTMELSASGMAASQRNGKQHGIQHDAAGQRGGTDQRDSENQAAEDQIPIDSFLPNWFKLT